ncbi:2TM domain-containing protein [Myroides sp. LJL119]
MNIPLFLAYVTFFIAVLLAINVAIKNKFQSLVERFIRKDKKNILIATIFISLASFIALVFLAFIIKWIDFYVIGNSSLSSFAKQNYWKDIFNFATTVSIIYALYTYVRLNTFSSEQIIEEQKEITVNVSAQFNSLKNQLDPHFLFNSLNVLSALIEEDQDKAVKFTHSLSKTYRYILDQKNKDLVSLEQEFAFARTYIELLQMRFEDSVIFEIPDQIKQQGAKVVPLSLQLLLENAIKHNKATESNPIKIQIVEHSNGYLEITNNLNKKSILDDRKGIGLSNITERYAFLSNKPVKIVETQDVFSVYIPILTKVIEHMKVIEEKQYNNEELLAQAKKKVAKIKKFYSHLTVYIMVNVFLIILNLLTEPNFMWSFIVLFAWGISIVVQGMQVYNYSFFLGEDWESKKIKEYINENKSFSDENK